MPGDLADHFEPETPRQLELRSVAQGALRENDLDTAITALLALRDAEPMSETRAMGMLLLSEIYTSQGRHDDALAVLEALRPASPPQAQLEYLLGRAYLRAERLIEAEDALRRAIRLDPDFLRPWDLLAQVLRDAGRTVDAEEIELGWERRVQLLGDQALNGDVEERLEAIEALGQSAPHPRLERALLAALDSPEPLLQVAAAFSLVEAGSEQAIAPLVAARTAMTDPRGAALIDQALAELQGRLAAEAGR